MLRLSAMLLRFLGVLVILLVSNVALGQSYSGPSRVDFDERLIKGQTTKAGSVYIFDRQQSDIRSLINKHRKFRYKIIRTVFESE